MRICFFLVYQTCNGPFDIRNQQVFDWLCKNDMLSYLDTMYEKNVKRSVGNNVKKPCTICCSFLRSCLRFSSRFSVRVGKCWFVDKTLGKADRSIWRSLHEYLARPSPAGNRGGPQPCMPSSAWRQCEPLVLHKSGLFEQVSQLNRLACKRERQLCNRFSEAKVLGAQPGLSQKNAASCGRRASCSRSAGVWLKK